MKTQRYQLVRMSHPEITPDQHNWGVMDTTSDEWVLRDESYTIADQLTYALNGQTGGLSGEVLEMARAILNA